MNFKLLAVIILNCMVCFYLAQYLRRTSRYSQEVFFKTLYTILSTESLNKATFAYILNEYEMVVKHITGDPDACGTIRVYNNTSAFGYGNRRPYKRFETLPIYFQYDMKDCHVHSGCRKVLSKRKMIALKYFTLNTLKMFDDYVNPKPFADYNYTLLTAAPAAFSNAA